MMHREGGRLSWRPLSFRDLRGSIDSSNLYYGTDLYPFQSGRAAFHWSRSSCVGRAGPKNLTNQSIAEGQAVGNAATPHSAMQALILVAEHNGPTMFARIGMMRALNRHVERVFNPERKNTRSRRRRLARDRCTQKEWLPIWEPFSHS